MRNILIHLEPSSVLPSILNCGHSVAKTFGSYIEGLHMQPGQPDVIAAGADGFVAAAPDLVAGFEREAKERAGQASALFEDFMTAKGLKRKGEAAPGEPCAGWRIELAGGQAAIGGRARIFDLVVMGRPVEGQLTPNMAALEAALFDSGRPVLVAPPQAPKELGKHVVIAWNGSSESARTVALAMPFIERAEKLTVLTIERGLVPGPRGDELSENLMWHGLNCDFIHADPGPLSIGEAILNETARIGGDLMIKGAYTQSRLRQMIFGGATSHILAHAELPVLMAN